MNRFFVGFRVLLPCTAKSIQVNRGNIAKYCQVTRQYCRVTWQYARSRGFSYFAYVGAPRQKEGFMYRRYRFSGFNTPLLFPGNIQGTLWGVFIENVMEDDKEGGG